MFHHNSITAHNCNKVFLRSIVLTPNIVIILHTIKHKAKDAFSPNMMRIVVDSGN